MKGKLDGDAWKKRLLYAVYFWGSIAISFAVCLLIVFLLRFWISEKLLEYIVLSILLLIGTAFVWGVFEYRDGYGSDHPFGKNELWIHLVAFAINLIGGLIFQYAIYTSGAAYYLTHIFWMQTGHEVIGNGSAPLWFYAAFMLLCDGIYLLSGWLAYGLGQRKRAADRSKLTVQPSK